MREHQTQRTSMQPEVSVIVLTYNQESTVRRTLESILSQKCDFPFEIVIGDDASSDNTLSICREYENKYPHIIHLIANTVNKGVIKNYFDCIINAKGKYIADCAGDDYWVCDTKLQQQYNILENEPNISVVHTDWMYENIVTGELTPHDTNRHEYFVPHLNGKILLKAYLRRDAKILIHSCTYMYRKHIIADLYHTNPEFFINKGWTAEDVTTISALLYFGDVAYIPTVTLHYSIGGNSISSVGDFNKTFDFYYGCILQNRYIADFFNVPQSELKDFYVTYIHFVLMLAIHSGDKLRREKLLEFVNKYRLPTSLKSKVAIALSSTQSGWKLLNKFTLKRH
jgi:glycosyltransferase involved in cell wall biosynthesis